MAITMSDEHRFDCDAQTYWLEVFFAPAFNQRLYVDTLGYRGWRLLDQKDDGARLTRRVQLDPPMGNMPGAVKKILGDAFSLMEEGTYDRGTQRYAFTHRPSVLSDKVNAGGEIWTEPHPSGGIVRHARHRAEVRFPLLGGTMEKEVLKDLQRSYALGNPLTTQFVRDVAMQPAV